MAPQFCWCLQRGGLSVICDMAVIMGFAEEVSV